ncbi:MULTISPECIES: hypothetical protein [Streptomyces]|uniref:Uncharacterized protein n=1 Tax=Streptomyces ramulosus TaxID=47762 RepID=A0ABW1FL49_9ACTN
MAGQRSGTALCGRLLLFAALLFGIVAMHSLGHCADHPAAGESAMAASAHHGGGPEPMAAARMSPAHASADLPGGTASGTTASGTAVRDGGATAADRAMDTASGTAMRGGGSAADMPMGTASATAPEDGAAPRAHAPLPLGGADPGAVCLAVLGAVALVTLGAALARRTADGGAATALARLPHALWPIPPPPHGILLARISVLRL